MQEEKILLYCGTGNGRSAAAFGQGVRYACAGKSVFVVRFLKGKASVEIDYLKRFEPEIKQFCFDKFDQCYSSLNEEEQAEKDYKTLTWNSNSMQILKMVKEKNLTL